ncbi:MAG: hypothetical protein WD929_08745 [Steroidobacteraceae bacterium]
MKRFQFHAAALLLAALGFAGQALAGDAPVRKIHLDQYNGYFSAEETLSGLQPGTYEFVVTNRAGKLVGFQVQNIRTHETLALFPLQPGETQSTLVEVTADGVRYRCPINPTPWYDLDVIKPAG